MGCMRVLRTFSTLFLLALGASGQVTTERLTTNLVRPTWAGAPAGDARVFIAEKRGTIQLLNGTALTTFLDITGLVTDVGEQGLLGVAFDPAFASNGHFFVDYIDNGGDTVIARYTVSAGNPNVADAGSAVTVLNVMQPNATHNGGCLQFGNDGYLYFALGDGTGGFDPDCQGQRLDTLLGGISRIDVSSLPYAIPPDNPFVGTPGARPELWHYGLRNPWRFCIDSVTDDMFIGDVGENEREEISAALAGASGINFGWKTLEGTRCVGGADVSCGVPPCGDPGYEPPIYELDHADGAQSFIGGEVYRGSIACERGNYFFSDFADDKIRSLKYDAVHGLRQFRDRTAELAPGGGLSIQNVSSFGLDGAGELLIVDDGTGSFNGEVYRMIPGPPSPASVVLDNGSGVNPPCFSAAGVPVLGQPFGLQVDVTGVAGASFTFFLARDAAHPGLLLSIGELLVSGNLLLVGGQATSGTVDAYTPNVPCTSSLVGFTGYFQAGYVAGGAVQLCNRIDATVGSF